MTDSIREDARSAVGRDPAVDRGGHGYADGMPDKPLRWRLFDAAEGAIGPRLEDAARSAAFLDALGLAARAQARVRRDLEAQSRRVWHLVNLPAGSDVTRLRHQVAELDRELRRVNTTLERVLEQQSRDGKDTDGDAAGRSTNGARARRAGGSRPPGRRAQRAPGA